MNLLETQIPTVFKFTDIFICVFFFILLVIGKKKGFMNQIIGFVSIIASFLVAIIFAKPLFEYLINNTSWFKSLETFLGDWVNNSFPELSNVSGENVSTLVGGLPFPVAVKQTITSFATQSDGQSVNLADIIAKTLFRYIGICGCFLAIFIAMRLLFFCIKQLVKALRTIAPIKWADELLGMSLMLFKGLAVLYILCFIVNILPLQGLDFAKEIVTQSYILRFLTNHNLFAYILKVAGSN